MMTLSERVAQMETQLAFYKTESDRLRWLAKMSVRVQVGDRWIYVPNYLRGINDPVYVVKSINRRRNVVRFEAGWNPLDDMEEDTGWVLLGRIYTKGDEHKLLGRKRGKVRKAKAKT